MCGILLSILLSLIKISERDEICQIPNFVKNEIKFDTKGMSEQEIVYYCCNYTCKTLKFSNKCEKITFKKESKAHCVIYARLCASLCNYAFKTNHINAKAKPVVGYLKVFDINLCKLISSKLSFNKKYYNFTKDHDFVEIIGSNHFFIDPCAQDLIGINLLTTTKCF